MTGEPATDRRLFQITGDDRIGFLQGLVTNDLDRLGNGLVYTALLSPPGKYLADFFVVAAGDHLLVDVKETIADALMRRLSMYRLRADVQIAASDRNVARGLGPAPDGAFADPRHPKLGWRFYGPDAVGNLAASGSIDWDGLRVAHLIPETGVELIPDESYILEMGFEQLSGVDFRKGCYVGQEVTARMKHKTELRKGLARVQVTGSAPVGTEITADGKPVGTLYTQSGGFGLAYLRFDRAQSDMQAGAAKVWLAAEGAA